MSSNPEPKTGNAQASPATENWDNRLSDYLDRLESHTEHLNELLDETRFRTVKLMGDQMDESTKMLAEAVGTLEQLVEERDVLLRADDAPPKGLSLSEKLLGSRKIEHARLARRCGEIAETVSLTHTRATALFVCQYHLCDTQADLLRRLSGAIAPPTYNRSGDKETGSGGGELFNEAA